MATLGRRVVYSPAADITEDTTVVVRCTATARGTGRLGEEDQTATAVAEETFIVLDDANPTMVATRINYRPVAADVGTTVVIRCTATARGSGILSALGLLNAIVSDDEAFQVISFDALAPTLSIGGAESITVGADPVELTIVHETPGHFDTIEYSWELDEVSAGSLSPNGMLATYSAPTTGYRTGVSFCVSLRVTAQVTGTGTNARDATTDMAEFQTEIAVRG